MSTHALLGPLLDEVQSFLESRVYPLEQRLLREGLHALTDELKALRAEVKARGWWCPPLPRHLGGMGLSLTAFAHLSERLGRTLLGHYLFNCQAPDIGNMELLLAHGTPEQQERFLIPLVRGEIRSCFAMTEPEHAGSNPVWLSTTARREGDHYVLDGHKWFVTGADGAAFAIVMAITNPDAERPHERASLLIVPTDTPGFVHIRRLPVMGELGEGWMSHSEVRFERCRVPLSYRLGPEGAGFALAQERLGPGRIHHAMRWIGICERALSLMCRHALRRELAPGHVLADQQVVRHAIADSRAEIEAARQLVLATAAKLEQAGPQAARADISLLKFYVAGVLQRVLDRALQVHGALGMTDDTLLAFWYRHERAARIYDGPDEVHRDLVARLELRRYLDHENHTGHVRTGTTPPG